MDDSISNFESKYLRTLDQKVKLINQIVAIPPGRDELFSAERFATLESAWKNFCRLLLGMQRNAELVGQCMRLAGRGEYENTRYVTLKKNIKRLYERIEKRFPGFFGAKRSEL